MARSWRGSTRVATCNAPAATSGTASSARPSCTATGRLGPGPRRTSTENDRPLVVRLDRGYAAHRPDEDEAVPQRRRDEMGHRTHAEARHDGAGRGRQREEFTRPDREAPDDTPADDGRPG